MGSNDVLIIRFTKMGKDGLQRLRVRGNRADGGAKSFNFYGHQLDNLSKPSSYAYLLILRNVS